MKPDLSVVGHEAAQAALTEAWRSGRMPHAWLLTGPEGIGKATLALSFARQVLLGGKGQAFDAPPDRASARMFAAGAHPDFRLIQRLASEQGGLRKEIVVAQIRALDSFFGMRVDGDGWRVVVIDAIDDLNRAAANALLKTLEEPPARTLFLAISHAPGRLLSTIRSRCRRLPMLPLDDAAVARVLGAAMTDGDADEIAALVALAEGRPGQALRYAGLRVAELEASVARLATPAGLAEVQALATALSGAAAQPRFEAFLSLVCRHLARSAERRRGASLAQALALWEKARALSSQAVPLALEPRAVVLELAALVRAH